MAVARDAVERFGDRMAALALVRPKKPESLPVRITRAKVQATLPQLPAPEPERLTRLFQTHDAPPDGYPVRDVVLFGLSEMARARRCLTLLRENNALELGRLPLRRIVPIVGRAAGPVLLGFAVVRRRRGTTFLDVRRKTFAGRRGV